MDPRRVNETSPRFDPYAKISKGLLFRTLADSIEESLKNNDERWKIFSSILLMAIARMLSSWKTTLWKTEKAIEEENWTRSFVESSTISSCTCNQHALKFLTLTTCLRKVKRKNQMTKGNNWKQQWKLFCIRLALIPCNIFECTTSKQNFWVMWHFNPDLDRKNNLT